MSPLLELIAAFARTGELGVLRCGLSLAEVEAALGRWEYRHHDARPRRWRPRVHGWGDLELLVCHSVVTQVVLRTRGETVLPAGLEPAGSHPAHFAVDEVEAAVGELFAAIGDAPGWPVFECGPGVRLQFAQWDGDGPITLESVRTPVVDCGGSHPDPGRAEGITPGHESVVTEQ